MTSTLPPQEAIFHKEKEKQIIAEEIETILSNLQQTVSEKAEIRRSIDSAISIRSIPMEESRIMMLKAEKGIFQSQQFVQVLSQNQERYLPLQEDPAIRTSQSNNWSPLAIWNPATRSWNLPPNINPNSFSNPLKITRSNYLHCVLLGLLICIGLSLGLAMSLHFRNNDLPFDASTGPRGSAPSSYAGPPLPVLGIQNGTDGVYFGAALDWSIDDPEYFNQDLGFSASIQDVVFFMNETFTTSGFVNSSGYIHEVSDVFLWTAALIRGTGAIMGISVIPTIPLTQVNRTGLELLAKKCKDVNDLGIPVLLRFAPDMNGNWHPYGQDPINYKLKFREMAGTVRNHTNNTALVWSPVSGLGYPFTPTLITPNRTEPRFVELDTSGDGILNSADDPFTPYYPGDGFVDWVGLSIFYSSNYPVHPRTYQRPSRILAQLPAYTHHPTPTSTGTSTSALPSSTPNARFDIIRNRIPPQPALQFGSPSFESQLTTAGTIFNFYRDFVETKRKPFILSDTGAGFFKGSNVISDTDEDSFKSAWYRQIMNPITFRKYPLIRAVVFYNSIIQLQDTTFIDRYDPGTLVDYSFTKNRTVLSSFQRLLSSQNLTGTLKFSNVTSASQRVFLTRLL
jgi:hypothetical protein